MCFTPKEFKKPKFIIDAHIGRVIRTCFCKFNEQNIVSVSNDKTFGLWDLSNRDQNGIPKIK